MTSPAELTESAAENNVSLVKLSKQLKNILKTGKHVTSVNTVNSPLGLTVPEVTSFTVGNLFLAVAYTLVPDHPHGGEGHDAEKYVQIEHQVVNHQRYPFPFLSAPAVFESFVYVTTDGLEFSGQPLHFSLSWIQQRIYRIA